MTRAGKERPSEGHSSWRWIIGPGPSLTTQSQCFKAKERLVLIGENNWLPSDVARKQDLFKVVEYLLYSVMVELSY